MTISQPIAIGGSNPLVLNDPQIVWIVTSSHVNLFMVHLKDGEPFGARHHVARIDAGKAIFGVDPGAFTHEWSLIAGTAPGTTVTQAARATLLNGSGPSLVENWIRTLSSAAARHSEPKGYVPLSVGQEFTVGRDPKVVVADHDVMWIRHIAGEGLFLNNAKIPAISGRHLFPLVSPGWIQELPSAKLIPISTEQALAGDPQLKLLDDYHRVIFASISWNEHVAEEKERKRLVVKEKGEASRLDLSLRYLAAPLTGARHLRPAMDTESPLLLACEEIGKHLNIEFRPHPDFLRGVAVKDPVAVLAKASAIRSRRVALGQHWWRHEGGALLAFRESDSRPLALLPERGNTYQVFDPVEGTRVPVNEDIIGSLEPFAHTFYRSFPPKKMSAIDLLRFGLHGNWGEVLVILLMGALGGLLSMATPILTRSLFDSIIPGAQRERLLELGVFLFSSSLAAVMFQLTRGFALLRMEGKMQSAVQSAVWDRLLSLPVPFFRQFSAGDLAVRGLAISAIRQVLTGSALSSIFSGIFSVFNFCLLFYYSKQMALVGLGLTLVALIITGVCGYFQVRQQSAMTELRGKITGTMLQYVMGIAKFRVSGTESRAFMGWASLFAKQKLFTFQSRRVTNWLTVFNSIFPALSLIVLFYTMASLMESQTATPISTGEFLAFTSAYGQFSASMLQLTSMAISLLVIVPMYERAKPILHALPEIDPNKVHAGELSGRIEINHVSLRYHEDSPLVLKDVSATINPGDFTAFVGPSGSGKSTIFRLLLGFEKPESGTVYFDGQDLSSLDIETVRQQMGVVMQNASLFSGDIFSNIVCAAPYTHDDAWEAAKLAGLDSDLNKMPMGMHTVIGEGGSGLSGGQRQRLMIARAIVGKPRILLFDEATSALDNQTQAIVSKSLQELKSTRIVIAHRLSTIVNADRIFVIHNGSIVQQGTYGELISQDGLFAELAKRQLT